MEQLKRFCNTAGISAWVTMIIVLIFGLQEVTYILPWNIAFLPLIGLIPVFLGLVFKGVVIDDKFDWKPFLYAFIGVISLVISMVLGIWFNHIMLM